VLRGINAASSHRNVSSRRSRGRTVRASNSCELRHSLDSGQVCAESHWPPRLSHRLPSQGRTQGTDGRHAVCHKLCLQGTVTSILATSVNTCRNAFRHQVWDDTEMRQTDKHPESENHKVSDAN